MLRHFKNSDEGSGGHTRDTVVETHYVISDYACFEKKWSKHWLKHCPYKEKSKEGRAINDIFQAGGSGEDSDDESISVHASENEFSEDSNDNDDPSDKLDSFDTPAPFSTENTDSADTLDPEWKDLLDSIEVNLGPKMEEDLAGIKSQIWVKST